MSQNSEGQKLETEDVTGAMFPWKPLGDASLAPPAFGGLAGILGSTGPGAAAWYVLPSNACVFTECSLPGHLSLLFLKGHQSYWIKGPPYAGRTSSYLDSFCKDSFQIRSRSQVLEIRTLYLLGGYIQLESLYFYFSRLECWLWAQNQPWPSEQMDIYCGYLSPSQRLWNEIINGTLEDWSRRRDRK